MGQRAGRSQGWIGWLQGRLSRDFCRFLSPDDTEQVKVLCRSWFPIEYPDTWYQEITANPR